MDIQRDAGVPQCLSIQDEDLARPVASFYLFENVRITSSVGARFRTVKLETGCYMGSYSFIQKMVESLQKHRIDTIGIMRLTPEMVVRDLRENEEEGHKAFVLTVARRDARVSSFGWFVQPLLYSVPDRLRDRHANILSEKAADALGLRPYISSIVERSWVTVRSKKVKSDSQPLSNLLYLWPDNKTPS